MSKMLTALMLTLSVGSSSVAMAGGLVRDHRGGRVLVQAAPLPVGEPMLYPSNTVIGAGASRYVGTTVTAKGRGQVAAITEPTRIDSGVLFVAVDPRARVSQDVIVQRVTGRTFVEAVKVQFASGAWQVIRPQIELTAAAPVLQLALEFSEPVVQIQVFGASAVGSAFQVLGR